MRLPASLSDRLADELGASAARVEPVGGGCIANASRLTLANGEVFFLKWSDGEAGETFPSEAESLRALAKAASAIRVPGVIAVHAATLDVPAFLVLEFIESGAAHADFWDEFGRGLAELHRVEGGYYGFPTDNFIGRLPQVNASGHSTWPEFFAATRLAPQVNMVRRSGAWRRSWDAPYNRLVDLLGDILPDHPTSSTLHGDLWGGNYMADRAGRPVIFDPATYFGDRETDLAMTELFGGFDARFYDAYGEAWPLEPGYDERRELYNLYHLLNHLNHFGAGYASSVDRVLRRF